MKKFIFLFSIVALSVAVAFDASARYRGDLNGDDHVDLADMVYLAKAIKVGSTDKALDVNTSGSVDDYDLQRLADIIISKKLTEDSGMNAGIGGWDDSGEDYGGTVKAPILTSRSAEDIRFYLRNPKWEGNDCYSIEFGIEEYDEAPVAILFSIRMPSRLQFDANKTVVLEPSVSASHKLYGVPKFVKENEENDWGDFMLRFIVMSPDLKALFAEGILGSIYYKVGERYGSADFMNCQVAVDDSGECMDVPDHFSGFSGNFNSGVDILIQYDSPCDILTTDGQLLRKDAPPSELEYLQRGLYIIRQRGKTIKLLK